MYMYVCAHLCVRSLQGMRGLQELSLAGGLLRDLHELRELQGAPELRSLWVGGCPVTRRPFFREHLLAYVPGLKVLDGRSLVFDAAQIHAQFCAAQFQLQQVCLQELRVAVLSHWVRLRACHMQLLKVAVGQFR